MIENDGCFQLRRNMNPRLVRSSRGFSLLEIILVLSILVVAAALVVPNVNKLLETQAARRQADDLRVIWERTRLKAMKSGQAQMFRYVIGSGKYSVEPWLQASDAAEAGAGATVMTMGGAVTTSETSASIAATTEDPSEEKQDELSPGVIFHAGSSLGDSRMAMLNAETGGAAMPASSGSEVIATPIVFYPDGTTSTAEVALRGTSGQTWLIRLRGLTGEVTVIQGTGVPIEDTE